MASSSEAVVWPAGKEAFFELCSLLAIKKSVLLDSTQTDKNGEKYSDKLRKAVDELVKQLEKDGGHTSVVVNDTAFKSEAALIELMRSLVTVGREYYFGTKDKWGRYSYSREGNPSLYDLDILVRAMLESWQKAENNDATFVAKRRKANEAARANGRGDYIPDLENTVWDNVVQVDSSNSGRHRLSKLDRLRGIKESLLQRDGSKAVKKGTEEKGKEEDKKKPLPIEDHLIDLSGELIPIQYGYIPPIVNEVSLSWAAKNVSEQVGRPGVAMRISLSDVVIIEGRNRLVSRVGALVKPYMPEGASFTVENLVLLDNPEFVRLISVIEYAVVNWKKLNQGQQDAIRFIFPEMINMLRDDTLSGSAVTDKLTLCSNKLEDFIRTLSAEEVHTVGSGSIGGGNGRLRRDQLAPFIRIPEILKDYRTGRIWKPFRGGPAPTTTPTPGYKKPIHKGGLPGVGTIVGENPLTAGGGSIGITDFSGLSSLYWSAQKMRAYLADSNQNGAEHLSGPALDLFEKKLQALKDGDLKDVTLGDETVWKTLNPQAVGAFHVRSLIEADAPGSKSVLELAKEKHKAYQDQFEAKLRIPGGIYEPTGKDYYFKTRTDGRYALMVRGGKTLSALEMREATRELIVITQDMVNGIHINIRVHDAGLARPEKAKDLAAIVVGLGAEFDKTDKVEEKDKTAHDVVEKIATKMKETATAPEFKEQQKTLYESVRRGESNARAIQTEILRHEDYLLMTANGRKAPKPEDVTDPDKQAYWSTICGLEADSGWSYLGASAILTTVFSQVNKPEDITDGIAAHLAPLERDKSEEISSESVRRSQSWRKESKGQRDEQTSDDDAELDSSNSEDDLAGDEENQENSGDKSLKQRLSQEQALSSSIPPAPAPPPTDKTKYRPLGRSTGQPETGKDQTEGDRFQNELEAKLAKRRGEQPGSSSSDSTASKSNPLPNHRQSAAIPPFTPEPQDELSMALKASAEQAEKEKAERGKIGKREILGFKLEDVDDRGNCFYIALAKQLEIVAPDQLTNIPVGTEPHDALRGRIEGAEAEDRRWGDHTEIVLATKKLNVVIAIIDTRSPEIGFRCYFCDEDGNPQGIYSEREVPRHQPIVRLAYTGNHYMSVKEHVVLTAGALREEYSVSSSAPQQAPHLLPFTLSDTPAPKTDKNSTPLPLHSTYTLFHPPAPETDEKSTPSSSSSAESEAKSIPIPVKLFTPN